MSLFIFFALLYFFCASLSFLRLSPHRPRPPGFVRRERRKGRRCLKLKGTTAQAKLENAVGVYGEIVSWYETYLATVDAEKNIQLFDKLLPDYAWPTPVKKVDFLLWSER